MQALWKGHVTYEESTLRMETCTKSGFNVPLTSMGQMIPHQFQIAFAITVDVRYIIGTRTQ